MYRLVQYTDFHSLVSCLIHSTNTSNKVGALAYAALIAARQEELDLLATQIHEAPLDNELEPTEQIRPVSPQESETSIPEPQKRMTAVTITLTQLTIATALAHCTPFIPTPSGMAPGLAGEGGRGGREAPTPASITPAVPAAPVQPGGNGRLEEKEPTIFMRDRGKADKFMHKLKIYQFLNRAPP